MLEHAAAIIGVPAAIKATLDIVDRIRRNGTATGQEPEAAAHLVAIHKAMEAFAVDANELAAYKKLHTLTNQLYIDLRQTFVLDNADRNWSRSYHTDHLNLIQIELTTVWEGNRAGGQLAGLRDDATLMAYLQSMPKEVADKTKSQTWNDYIWNLLEALRKDVESFPQCHAHVINLRGITGALNNYANRSMERGIDVLDNLMARLRDSLAQNKPA